MLDEFFVLLISIFVALVAFGAGWALSANNISQQCNKLGRFYITTTIYECKASK